jgi:uncharacterized spore protein YtfJ
MKVDELVNQARESLTVRRVYGDPVDHDGLTVIPAASIAGGFGGGSGKDATGQEGEGGGFGMNGRPAGAFVIQNGEVSWRPAVDVNRVIGVIGLALVTYLVMRPRMARARAEIADRS